MGDLGDQRLSVLVLGVGGEFQLGKAAELEHLAKDLFVIFDDLHEAVGADLGGELLPVSLEGIQALVDLVKSGFDLGIIHTREEVAEVPGRLNVGFVGH